MSDERGIRTPEAQSTTGLAILRHTGLGYLVRRMCWSAPLNAIYIFNAFFGSLTLNSSGRHTASCWPSYLQVVCDLASTPQPSKRWLSTVSLLPSGPRPVPAVKIWKQALQQAFISTPSKQDGASTLRSQVWKWSGHLLLASSPAYRRYRVTGNAELPGLARHP